MCIQIRYQMYRIYVRFVLARVYPLQGPTGLTYFDHSYLPHSLSTDRVRQNPKPLKLKSVRVTRTDLHLYTP